MLRNEQGLASNSISRVTFDLPLGRSDAVSAGFGLRARPLPHAGEVTFADSCTLFENWNFSQRRGETFAFNNTQRESEAKPEGELS